MWWPSVQCSCCASIKTTVPMRRSSSYFVLEASPHLQNLRIPPIWPEPLLLTLLFPQTFSSSLILYLPLHWFHASLSFTQSTFPLPHTLSVLPSHTLHSSSLSLPSHKFHSTHLFPSSSLTQTPFFPPLSLPQAPLLFPLPLPSQIPRFLLGFFLQIPLSPSFSSPFTQNPLSPPLPLLLRLNFSVFLFPRTSLSSFSSLLRHHSSIPLPSDYNFLFSSFLILHSTLLFLFPETVFLSSS